MLYESMVAIMLVPLDDLQYRSVGCHGLHFVIL